MCVCVCVCVCVHVCVYVYMCVCVCVCVCVCTGVATKGTRGATAPSLLSCFGAVSMSWFTFAIASILCCGPLTCLLLATPLCMCVCLRACNSTMATHELTHGTITMNVDFSDRYNNGKGGV